MAVLPSSRPWRGEPSGGEENSRATTRISFRWWLLVFLAICGVLALLVSLGMGASEAGLAAPLLVGSVTKLIFELQSSDATVETTTAISTASEKESPEIPEPPTSGSPEIPASEKYSTETVITEKYSTETTTKYSREISITNRSTATPKSLPDQN
jgi:hypothetical protein